MRDISSGKLVLRTDIFLPEHTQAPRKAPFPEGPYIRLKELRQHNTPDRFSAIHHGAHERKALLGDSRVQYRRECGEGMLRLEKADKVRSKSKPIESR